MANDATGGNAPAPDVVATLRARAEPLNLHLHRELALLLGSALNELAHGHAVGSLQKTEAFQEHTLRYLASICISGYARHRSSERNERVEESLRFVQERMNSAGTSAQLVARVGAARNRVFGVRTPDPAQMQELEALHKALLDVKNGVTATSFKKILVAATAKSPAAPKTWDLAWQRATEVRNQLVHPVVHFWRFHDLNRVALPVLLATILELLGAVEWDGFAVVVRGDVGLKTESLRERPFPLPLSPCIGALEASGFERFVLTLREGAIDEAFGFIELAADGSVAPKGLFATVAPPEQPQPKPPTGRTTPSVVTPAASVQRDGPWTALATPDDVFIAAADDRFVEVRALADLTPSNVVSRWRLDGIVTGLRATSNGRGVVALASDHLEMAFIRRDASLNWCKTAVRVPSGARLIAATSSGDQWRAWLAVDAVVTVVAFDSHGSVRDREPVPAAVEVAHIGDALLELDTSGVVHGALTGVAPSGGPIAHLDAATDGATSLACFVARERPVLEFVRTAGALTERRKLQVPEPVDAIVVARPARGAGPLSAVLGSTGNYIHLWRWDQAEPAR